MWPLFEIEPPFVAPPANWTRQSFRSRDPLFMFVVPAKVITPRFAITSLRLDCPPIVSVPVFVMVPPVFWFSPPEKVAVPSFWNWAESLKVAAIVQVAPGRLISDAKPFVLKPDGNDAVPKLSKMKLPETAVDGIVTVPRLYREPLALLM